MKLLLDTHLILWAGGWVTSDGDDPMPADAARLIDDPTNDLCFSPASIWEIAIKHARGRPDFGVHVDLVRRELLENRYDEIAITSEHAAAVSRLPPIHKDPFDRLLIAQANVEGVTLLTADPTVAGYPGPIRLV